MIMQTLGRGSDGATSLRDNDLPSHLVWKNNKYRLGIAQECTIGRVREKRTNDLLYIALQQPLPHRKIVGLMLVSRHMSLRVNETISDESWIVDQTCRDGARQRIATALVSIIKPSFSRQRVDELLAAGQRTSPANVHRSYHKMG
jgi:hypothetical protein